MVVLDEPYASAPLVEWLAASHHPVLDNAFARELAHAGNAFNLVSEDEAARRIEKGERVYTNSENALAWVVDHVENDSLTSAISLFKDKAAMRQRLAALCPGLFFATYARDELSKVDVGALPLPVVLKPAVGFCSMGVYVIESVGDWARALADIEAAAAQWAVRYPASVIDVDSYVVEGYVAGTEYALDAYFDEKGAACVLNVLRHDFAGPDDTSDRMYLTNAAIVEQMGEHLRTWLNKANELVGARNFPVHVEVRVDEAGNVIPIEFNPLRFAGLGGTDIAYYGYGLRTYEAFLHDIPVDFSSLFAGKKDKVYSMSLLAPASGADLTRSFDAATFVKQFSRVLAYVPFDVNTIGSYGFLFLETDEATVGERDALLHADLAYFVR